MQNIIKNLTNKNTFNDNLLNELLEKLENMKSNDKINIELKYADVTNLIHLLITNNLNVELCTWAISKGIEQRKSEKK